MPAPVLLTTNEVAEIFRVRPETVTKWAREGTIAALKAPGKGGYRFHRSDVERLLAAFSGSTISADVEAFRSKEGA